MVQGVDVDGLIDANNRPDPNRCLGWTAKGKQCSRRRKEPDVLSRDVAQYTTPREARVQKRATGVREVHVQKGKSRQRVFKNPDPDQVVEVETCDVSQYACIDHPITARTTVVVLLPSLSLSRSLSPTLLSLLFCTLLSDSLSDVSLA